jgi:ferredoxin-thioredoxin reductase catalytic subunit
MGALPGHRRAAGGREVMSFRARAELTTGTEIVLAQAEKHQKDLETCLAETRVFVQKVVDRFGFKFNPEAEINETVIQGLAHNQHKHGRRYCPCFVVQFDKAVDRICPCKPGIQEEVPRDGHCHCGIFCAEDYKGEPYEAAAGSA